MGAARTWQDFDPNGEGPSRKRARLDAAKKLKGVGGRCVAAPLGLTTTLQLSQLREALAVLTTVLWVQCVSNAARGASC